MSIGQLYIVSTRATTDAGEKIKEKWLVNASTPDEAYRKLHYQIDSSKFKTFSFTSCEKVKPGTHRISRVITATDIAPLIVDAAGAGHVQRTNQPANIGSFAVGVACSVNAVDEDHALRKVGGYLIDRGSGRDNDRVHANRTVIVEALGQADSTVVANLENPFVVQRIFRGGAASPR